MKKLKIFLSKEDNSLESAIKIKNEALLKTTILYIEDYVNNNNLLKEISNNDIIYFLCNGSYVYQIIEELKKLECLIVNKNFLNKNCNKAQVQELLKKEDITIPKLISKEQLTHEDFPLFCKENAHTAITVQMYNKSTLEKFFEKFDKNNFYLEEVIVDKKYTINEIKVYFVKDEVFEKDGKMEINLKIKEICKKISKSLDIEIFSVDLIKTSSEYYVIDLNPASGFFYSTRARNYFLEKLMEI